MNIGKGFGDFFQWDVEELSGIGQEGWEEETEWSGGHWTKLNNSVFAEKEISSFWYHLCMVDTLGTTTVTHKDFQNSPLITSQHSMLEEK